MKRENSVVTEHTNEAGQTTPDTTGQKPDASAGEPKWYAIHTYSGYENKVKSHLEARIASMDMRNKIFRVIVPMEEEEEINKGQCVRVIDGPFTEFIGTVSDINMDRNKVTVLVSFFGRETPVVLDFLQVEKIEGTNKRIL